MPAQTSSYFEHDADIGIIGRGNTLEQAFETAAQAVFGIVSSRSRFTHPLCSALPTLLRSV